MKERKRLDWQGRCLGLAVILWGVTGFCGCGGSAYDNTTAASAPAASAEMAVAANTAAGADGYASEDIYEYGAEEMPAEEANSAAADRKLIKTVNMSVETEEFDSLIARLEQKVASLGGYIENMNLYNGSSRSGQRSRDASMTIRIPKENLSGFVSEVSEVSNVVSKSESTEDVTLSYVDLESHKKALQVEQERLLELLEQAVSMEDIIAIEERLSQVRYQLESMESQLRTYDNLVDYSTVYLSVNEVERLTPVEEVSDLTRMGQGFVRSVQNLFLGIKNFLIGLVICLPYLLFLAVLVLVIVLILRAALKWGGKKEEEKIQRIYDTYKTEEEPAADGEKEKEEEFER